jgi:hypothetical protein
MHTAGLTVNMALVNATPTQRALNVQRRHPFALLLLPSHLLRLVLRRPQLTLLRRLSCSHFPKTRDVVPVSAARRAKVVSEEIAVASTSMYVSL